MAVTSLQQPVLCYPMSGCCREVAQYCITIITEAVIPYVDSEDPDQIVHFVNAAFIRYKEKKSAKFSIFLKWVDTLQGKQLCKFLAHLSPRLRGSL